MGRLIFYESQKLMGKRLVPVLLLFLFAFNGLMLYRESRQRIDWSCSRRDVGRVYEDLVGCTALEAEEKLAEKKELLLSVSVWREWTDGYVEWNGEERRAFQERNREVLEKNPDLDPEGSNLSYLTNFIVSRA